MLYPPTLANTQPVFSYSDSSFTIHYTLAQITNPNEVIGIDVFIAQQSNDRSIYLNGIQNYPVTLTKASNDLIINFDSAIMDLDRWQPGYLYKVQLRLVGDQDATSEWSTVMIIKPITEPTVSIFAEGTDITGGTNSIINSIRSINPTFQGICSLDPIEKEVEESYQFIIYKGEEVVYESGWLPHKIEEDKDTWYCDLPLQNRGVYFVEYEIRTNNGYFNSYNSSSFQTFLSTFGNLSLNFRALPNKTNASIDLMVEPDELRSLTGSFVISRTSELSDFKKFEVIKYVNYLAFSIEQPKVIFSDYTIESGIVYQYSFQQILSNGYRTNMKLTNNCYVDFEYAYLYRDNVQLKISFNQNISSFKHTVLRNKQDTLGDKYPHLSQNGNAYYAEFSLSGLISYQDNLQTFFYYMPSGVYYQDNLIIDYTKFEARAGENLRSPTSAGAALSLPVGFEHKAYYNFGEAENGIYADADDSTATSDRRSGSNPHYVPEPAQPIGPLPHIDYSISTDLTDNNIFIERKFREKVEEFLNDFKCKLYKSPTEGNIPVVLMNVTLKPVESVGRMLYEFSATAYELLDNTLEELNNNGIITIGEEGKFDGDISDTITVFGQVVIDHNTDADEVFSLMNEQSKIDLQDGVHEYTLHQVKTLWIEPINSEVVNTEYITFNYGSDNVNSQLLLPTNKVNTINLPSGVNKLQFLGLSEMPIVVNYTGELTLSTISTVTTVTQIEISCDLNQLIWRRSQEQGKVNIDLYSLIIQKIMAEKGAILIDGVWQDPEENIEYYFDNFISLDIETANPGVVIQLGTNSSSYSTFIIGNPPYEEDSQEYQEEYGEYGNNIHKTSLNSFRIIFPLNGQGYNIPYIGYFKLLGSLAEQVIINFIYQIEERHKTEEE